MTRRSKSDSVAKKPRGRRPDPNALTRSGATVVLLGAELTAWVWAEKQRRSAAEGHDVKVSDVVRDAVRMLKRATEEANFGTKNSTRKRAAKSMRKAPVRIAASGRRAQQELPFSVIGELAAAAARARARPPPTAQAEAPESDLPEAA